MAHIEQTKNKYIEFSSFFFLEIITTQKNKVKFNDTIFINFVLEM